MALVLPLMMFVFVLVMVLVMLHLLVFVLISLILTTNKAHRSAHLRICVRLGGVGAVPVLQRDKLDGQAGVSWPRNLKGKFLPHLLCRLVDNPATVKQPRG